MANNPLSGIRILHIDPDKSFITLIRNVMSAFGFADIDTAQNGKEAIQKMARKNYDIVICEWSIAPIDGLDFVTYIRKNENSPDYAIPIIMLTARSEGKNIQKARDVGITEFLTKPFTINALRQRIVSVVERPREFVLSDGYCGPSRRRQRKEAPIKERRSRGAQSMEEFGTRIVKKYNAKILSPNFKLKRKIGSENSIDKLISLEKIKKAETIVEESAQGFIEESIGDIDRLKKKFNIFMNEFVTNKNSEEAKSALEELKEVSVRIKGNAGIYGYTLATNVANTLFSFCNANQIKTKRDLEVIDVHINALEIIFQKNIKGEFGVLGKELIRELSELIRK